MSLATQPLRLFDSLLDRAAAVAGALAVSQLPGFMRHYLQRLGGHVAEARRNLITWQEIANRITGGDLHLLITRLQSVDTPESVEAGGKCAADLLRLESLLEARDALAAASPWTRVFAFLRHADREIAQAALGDFVPNVPINPEGLVYALVGLLLGWGLYRGIRKSMTASVSHFRHRDESGKNKRAASNAKPAAS